MSMATLPFWIFLRLSFCFVSSAFLSLFIKLDRLGSGLFLHNHDLKGRFVFLQVALPALTEISSISSEIEFFGKKNWDRKSKSSSFQTQSGRSIKVFWSSGGQKRPYRQLIEWSSVYVRLWTSRWSHHRLRWTLGSPWTSAQWPLCQSQSTYDLFT